MTLQQQLNDLDSRLGKGVGAVKQRKRIQYAIDHPQIENQKKGKSKKSNACGLIFKFFKLTSPLHTEASILSDDIPSKYLPQ